MSSFKSNDNKLKTPSADPRKHVNFIRGMILGVDDFNQEFAYLSGRSQWLARDLLGYGTVNGLKVSIDPDGDKGPKVEVGPGTALSPSGQLIRLAPAQCAYFNKWLADEKNVKEVVTRLGSPGANTLTLYVVLRYSECLTDDVSIPGEPCRSEDEIKIASRIADDFNIEFTFDPPNQCEEDALVQFVKWLSHIGFTENPGDAMEQEDFLAEIRNLFLIETSPPCTSPAIEITSPPLKIMVPAKDACQYLQAAFKLWVTELRPRFQTDWFAKLHSCLDSQPIGYRPPEEDSLLLAKLNIPLVRELSGEWKAGNLDDIKIIEDKRPYVIHLRMLQQWLLCGQAAAVGPSGEITSPPAGGLVSDHGALAGLNDDDHLQYLPVNPGTRALANDLDGDGNRIVNLTQGTAAGEAVVFQQAVKLGDAAGGDLGGTYPDPAVNALRGRPVSGAGPALSDVLTWTGAEWAPQAVAMMLPFVTITRVSVRLFELWFNLDAPSNRLEISALTAAEFEVSMETNTPTRFLSRINVTDVTGTGRNRFRIILDRESELIRFSFNIARIQITDGTITQPILDYSRSAGMSYLGYDGNARVTVFVRVNR